MEKILCLLHTDNNNALPKPALEALGCAQSLAKEAGVEFCVALVGGEIQSAANSIAGCGAAKFLGVAGEEFAQGRYASDAAAAEALIKATEATLVIAPHTSRWSRCLAGVSHRVGGKVDTHATAVIADGGAIAVMRWFYRQRMVGQLKRTQRPWLVTVEPGSCPPAEAASGDAAVEIVSVSLPELRSQVTGVKEPAGGQQTIRPEAEILLVAGAGWTKKQADGQPHVEDAEKLILDFITKNQASLGSSKSLVDQKGEGQKVISFMSHLNQVGQTGATPRHPKGLATCCHGEEPHVVGWRFVNERRAINLDANCGWAQGKADVLYVADAFEVVEKINAML